MKKIKRPLKLFPIDLLLLSINNRQRVMCKYFIFNKLKNENNENQQLSIQNSQKGRFFENYSGGIPLEQ